MASHPLKSCSDEEFVQLFRTLGPSEAAKRLGVGVRRVFERRRKLEKAGGSIDPPSPLSKTYPWRVPLTITNGTVLIGSDFHIWPGEVSTCLRAFKKFVKDTQPNAIILNGDVMDFPKISRHPQNWETAPDVRDEIEAAQDHLADIVTNAKRGCHKIWCVGNHDCLDKDTECLTQRGWLPYTELRDDDKVLSLVDKKPVWSRINERLEYDYDGELIRIEQTRMSMAVTPNHRVMFRSPNWKTWIFGPDEFERADSLRAAFYIPMSGQSEKPDYKIPDDMIKLVGWIVTDGYYKNSTMVVYQSKPEGVAEITAILNRLGLAHSVYINKRQIKSICGRDLIKPNMDNHCFRLLAESIKIVKDWLPENGVLPAWVRDLSERQFSLLLDTMVAADGCWDGGDPSAKRCAVLYGRERILSSIQAASVLHGWRSRLAVDNRGDLRLCLAKKETLKFEKKNIFREDYVGKVWCLRVPHENFMVRRNGCAYFTGNSRLETLIANATPQMKGVKGIHLSDHFTIWQKAMSCMINEGLPGGATMVKHRLRGGIGATRLNTLNAGISIVTGHLHSQNVRPLSDYNKYDRYGVDTGCVADKDHRAFTYTEDAPVDWRSGFALLTYVGGRLLYPELITKFTDDSVQFRGKIIKV